MISGMSTPKATDNALRIRRFQKKVLFGLKCCGSLTPISGPIIMAPPVTHIPVRKSREAKNNNPFDEGSLDFETTDCLGDSFINSPSFQGIKSCRKLAKCLLTATERVSVGTRRRHSTNGPDVMSTQPTSFLIFFSAFLSGFIGRGPVCCHATTVRYRLLERPFISLIRVLINESFDDIMDPFNCKMLVKQTIIPSVSLSSVLRNPQSDNLKFIFTTITNHQSDSL